MKKLVAAILLACLLMNPVLVRAEGLFGGLIGDVFGKGEFDGGFSDKCAAIEAFFDEYVEFMKKMEKDPSDLAVLAEYATMMSRYADAMSALDSINEDELTAAEQRQYLEMLARVDAKLLAVGLTLD